MKAYQRSRPVIAVVMLAAAASLLAACGSSSTESTSSSVQTAAHASTGAGSSASTTGGPIFTDRFRQSRAEKGPARDRSTKLHFENAHLGGGSTPCGRR